jgi:hypothetical protein
MRPGRTLLVLVGIAAGLGISLVLLSNELPKLHAEGFLNPTTPGLLSPTPGRPHAHARPPLSRVRRSHPRRHPSRRPARAVARTRPGSLHRRAQPSGLPPLGNLHVLIKIALEIASGLGLVGLLLVVLVVRRARRRWRRRYELYALHLSMHDQAKPQDLQDMVESIANIVRAFPGDRIRHGQPYVALELICNEGRQGTEWSVNVRCEPASVSALDAAISATYPDVRVGRRHAETPRQRAGALSEPGHVMRFRKQRSFVYGLMAAGVELASPPLEQIARAQVALGEPSIVRFQLTPTPSFFEEYARRLHRRHERTLARQEHWGLPEGGLQSTLNRAEMANAQRTQNRSLFWLETVIAADTTRACKTIAAAVQSRRGENRLHRRQMIIRQRLYRRRFPRALGPLIPSTRSLVSAAEVAHLLELPTARMKGVPVRRLTLPRIPLPPDIVRADRPRPAHPTNAPTDRHASRRAHARQSPSNRKPTQ